MPQTPVENDGCTISVCVLASGSKGNAIYVSDGATAILVDAGLSGVEIERRMNLAGLAMGTVQAIVVSHEHSDHIRGVGILSRRYKLPVYLSEGTRQAADGQLGKVHELRPFDIGRPFAVQGLAIHPFATSHDAEDPSGFTIGCNGHKIGICTDLGIATGMVKEHLKACRLLVLEANHDPTMLLEGPYPWPLKQRIKSRNGHLANEESGQLLAEVCHDGLCHVVLAHLSETNNTPRKALQCVRQVLGNAPRPFQIHVACQDSCSQLLTVR